MSWSPYLTGFKAYLLLEKALSTNSISSYLSDVEKLHQFSSMSSPEQSLKEIKTSDLENFLNYIYEIGLSEKSQARILSGIKAFFKYLVLEKIIPDDPSELLSGPKLEKKLPDVLEYSEVRAIIDGIDVSEELGHRNKAIFETLYSCGLRVSELVNLKISNVYIQEQYIRVVGKNNKERLIPIGEIALQAITIYLENFRRQVVKPKKGDEDVLFLNRRNGRLTREMIFHLVKQFTLQAAINKNVSPHTFRHSFATHLVEGGADLRAVQEMLGHESIITTELYTHLNTDYLRSTILNFHPSNMKKSR